MLSHLHVSFHCFLSMKHLCQESKNPLDLSNYSRTRNDRSSSGIAGFQDLCLIVSYFSFNMTPQVSILSGLYSQFSSQPAPQKLSALGISTRIPKPSMHKINKSCFSFKYEPPALRCSVLSSLSSTMGKRRELGDLSHLTARGQRELVRVQEYVMHMALLTAGASVSGLMVFLMEQWRACVFIVLNLVLLSILFTSVSSDSEEHQGCKGEVNEADRVQAKAETNKWRQCRWPPAAVDEDGVKECEEEEWFEVKDRLEMEEEEIPKLSKEALNEKVEAFIVMFRQHLISDARKRV